MSKLYLFHTHIFYFNRTLWVDVLNCELHVISDRITQIETINNLVCKKYMIVMPLVHGQPSLYSCVISDFIKTPRAGDRHGHTAWFVFAVQALCFLRGPGCVAEWEETCWSLTVLMPHSQGFPGRSDTHKQVHSIPEDMLDRRDHRLPGNKQACYRLLCFIIQ